VKKFLIVTILLIIFGSGFYIYVNYFKQPTLTVWSFVPADAIAVYSSKNSLKEWEENKEKKIWKNLRALPAFKQMDEDINILDSLSGKNGSIQSFFEKNQMLFSFHTISQNSIDILFSIKVINLSQHELLEKIIKSHLGAKKVTQNTRQYLGFTITELNTGKENFAYIFYKNFFIGSFTPFLVEDAIRVIEEEDAYSFYERHSDIFEITRLEQDQGDLYINTEKLNQILGVFTNPIKTEQGTLSSLSEVTFLDLSVNDENILMTGFSLNSPLKANYLNAFDNVSSSEFEMLKVIPNNTAALFHYSFNDPEKWHTDLKGYWRKMSPTLLTNLVELENKYEIKINDLYDFMGTELGLMIIESVNPDIPDLLACIKVSNSLAANKFMESLEQVNHAGEKYDESWSDIKLGQIDIEEIPAQLFGPIFSGFKSTFYCQIGDFILMGNNEQTLKQLIDDVNSGETWRKSLKVNKFLDVANREANLSLFVNSSGAWNFVGKFLNEKWKNFFVEHSSTLKQIEYAAFQFSNVDGKYYTSIALQHSGDIVRRNEATEFQTESELEFGHDLITKPFIVRNYNDESLEMIVQDSLKNIFLVSSNFDTLWSKSIDSRIISPVYQVDSYKNKKLQFLFASEGLVHAIDRTGANIPGFPFKLPYRQNIKLLSLIDYDNSRNYRLMASCESGQYFLFDKSGVNLEGWAPKVLEGSPVIHPFHLRIRSKDYIMFMHENGLVYVLNRRGDPVTGFPLDIKGKTNNPLFIQKGGSLSDTKFSALTDEGEIVEFNLEGKFIKREQLLKSTLNDKFNLVVSSPNEKTYLVLRSDEQKITVIDSQRKELFDHNIGTPSLLAKYYNFSSDNQILILTDIEKEYTYIYNLEGKLLHSLLLETGAEIAMQYFSSEGVYKIYKTYNNKLSLLNLKR
jgi:virulence-associated protein VapD